MAPKQKRLFYGWIIVFVMAVASAVGMGMGSLNFGLYIKPMGDELGIGRASFGWASTFRSISSAATSPWSPLASCWFNNHNWSKYDSSFICHSSMASDGSLRCYGIGRDEWAWSFDNFGTSN